MLTDNVNMCFFKIMTNITFIICLQKALYF